MSSSEVLNAACPACGQQGGHIVSLPVDGPVSYKCLQCGNAWELSDTVEGNVRHEIDFKINSIGNGCELLVDGVELVRVVR
jgi:DNA-directed RNA polymerase subunit RPC12/RpoP